MKLNVNDTICCWNNNDVPFDVDKNYLMVAQLNDYGELKKPYTIIALNDTDEQCSATNENDELAKYFYSDLDDLVQDIVNNYDHVRKVVLRYVPGLEGYPLFNKWYCAYLQVSPNVATMADSKLDDLFPQALGGITHQGHLPNTLADDGKWYVGFDTAHFNMQHATLKQVLGALKEMEKKYDRYLESGGARR
ncbi:hypothetical protein [Lactobacillus crispatus]|uniref:hypothetical protein n=1 Tax=Lactobacillus crispatus TaxID=47770 RepID=UPI0023A9CE8B|nr:hypothetical protein [Lactobacillus crispatus]WEB33790.1 hypothetical protein PUW44_06050 [Lactobacillus crispatus]